MSGITDSSKFNKNSSYYVEIDPAAGGGQVIQGNLQVTGNISAGGNSTTTGTAQAGSLAVTGASSTGSLNVAGASTLSGAVTASAGLAVTGNSILTGSLTATGLTTAGGGLNVSGAAALGGALTTNGLTTASGGLNVSNGAIIGGGLNSSGLVTAGAGLNVTGAVTASGLLTATGGLAGSNHYTFTQNSTLPPNSSGIAFFAITTPGLYYVVCTATTNAGAVGSGAYNSFEYVLVWRTAGNGELNYLVAPISFAGTGFTVNYSPNINPPGIGAGVPITLTLGNVSNLTVGCQATIVRLCGNP